MLVKLNIVGFGILSLCSCAGQILAGTHEFGSGSFEFSIEFVAVGDAGNRADEDGWYPGDALATAPGRVEYPFEIAKYEEIESNIDNAILGGLAVKIDQRGPNAPVTAVTFEEAARYANWLNSSSGFAEAYKFDGVDVVDWSPEDVGYDPNNPTRNRFAKYALPTHDEWYKAAYYDAETESYFEYPTGSNAPPVPTTFGTSAGTAVFGGLVEGPVPPVGAGGESPYGTVGQGGNVSEWLETPSLRVNVGSRFIRGGDFLNDAIGLEARTLGLGMPHSENSALGFRIVSVPEPSSWLIALIGVAAVPMVCRRRSG